MNEEKTENESVVTFDQLVMRLERIAKKNHDMFRYNVDIEIYRSAIKYIFVCEEVADGNTLLAGEGLTINEAIKDAWDGIENACKEWSYDAVVGGLDSETKGE